MDRIEPIRRDDGLRGVPPVAPVAWRDRERRNDDRDRPRRRAHEPAPAITRDDDGTLHVDLRA